MLLAVVILCGSASLAQASFADSCASCHAESLAPKLRDPVRLQKADVHGAAGLGCASCHGGDPAGQTALSAHAGAGFIARPSGTSVMGAMCGRCHKQPAENYLKSPHQNARDAGRRPNCATCHGAHGIVAASLDLIAEPLCNSCHAIEPARRIYKALSEAEREVSGLDAELARTGNSVAARARLKDARSELRGLSHSLDLLAITRNAAHALTVVDEVRSTALPRVAAKDWGRILRVALQILAALVLAAGAVAGGWLAWTRRRKLPFIGKLGRPQLKWLGLGAGVLGASLAIVGWRANRYIEHEPKFCLSCHTMNSAFDLWEKSGHKNIECHTCHKPDVVANLHQLWVYTTKKPDMVVKHAEIDRSVCERCHAGGTSSSKWNRVVETAGHRVHVGKQRIECVQCHAMSVHAFKPPRDMCLTCHKQITLAAAGTMAEMHCLNCHPFLASESKRPLKPDRAVCLDCHERRQVNGEVFPTAAAKAPMSWDCGRCHKPHEKIAITNAECVSCHKAITEGLHRVKAHADDCLGCHKPHDWTSGTKTCAGCHAMIEPAKHHPGKTCIECHGAWDDAWVPMGKLTAK